MKAWMKTTIAAALVATTAIGASAAMARGGHCDGQGPGGGGPMMMQRLDPAQMAERIAQRAETRLARLELALALKPDQQAAWTQFKGAMLVRAKDMGERMAAHRQGERPDTALERLQRMEEMSRAAQAGLADTRRAVEALYPQLSDAQKKVFDADFQMGPRGAMGERGMGPGKGGGMGPGMSPGMGGSRG